MIHAIINRRSYGVAAGFVLEEQIGNRTASSIQVLLGRQPLPSAGDIVDLVDTDAGRSVFWGVCSIVRRVGIQMAPAGAVAELVCTNANALLSRRLVNLALRNKTVTQIVQALFDGYIAADGISLGALSRFDLEVEVYTASDLNLQKALDELAELVGAGWNVTPDRKFVFIGKEDFPRLPVPLNNRSLPLFELSSACRDSDVRTVQIIKGSSQKTDPQLEAHVYNGRASEFVLSFPLSQRPNITVNGAAVSENAVGINGLNSGDASKAFLFSFQSPTVIYNPSNTVLALAKGDTVEFEYVGFFPIRVENADSARIREVRAATGTSGIIENVSVSHSLTAWSDAQGLADAMLRDFGKPRNELQFVFDSYRMAQFGLNADDFALFTVLDVELDGLKGEYIIVERRIEPVYAGQGAPARYRIGVKCVDRSILKGYGSVLFSMKHELTNLRVRADEKVLSNVNASEELGLGEVFVIPLPVPFYPTQSGIFEPADLCGEVFPV